MPAEPTAEAEKAARHFYDALSTGDLGLVDESLAPTWEQIPASGHTSPGATGWKETIGFLRTVFPDIRVTVEDLIVSGDTVAVRTLTRGTHSAELMGIPATGRTVEFRSADFHRVEQGRITQSCNLEDYFGMLTQLGATFTVS